MYYNVTSSKESGRWPGCIGQIMGIFLLYTQLFIFKGIILSRSKWRHWFLRETSNIVIITLVICLVAMEKVLLKILFFLYTHTKKNRTHDRRCSSSIRWGLLQQHTCRRRSLWPGTEPRSHLQWHTCRIYNSQSMAQGIQQSGRA